MLERRPNPARGRAISHSEHEDLITNHRARMAQATSKQIYRLRKQTVELEYADLKHNRALRTFSGFGLARARIEVGLHELSHNLATVENWLQTRSETAAPAEITVANAS